jgi:hypothetical protein
MFPDPSLSPAATTRLLLGRVCPLPSLDSGQAQITLGKNFLPSQVRAFHPTRSSLSFLPLSCGHTQKKSWKQVVSFKWSPTRYVQSFTWRIHPFQRIAMKLVLTF